MTDKAKPAWELKQEARAIDAEPWEPPARTASARFRDCQASLWALSSPRSRHDREKPLDLTVGESGCSGATAITPAGTERD
jgi:hypothetical protein